MTDLFLETRFPKNFRPQEFFQHNPGLTWKEIPLGAQTNILLVANRLQVLRDIWLKKIIISSGYRTPAHNREVGGAVGSLHLTGQAGDIVVDGMSAEAVQYALAHWSGGMGSYDKFTHVDIGPDRRWRG